MPAPRTLRTPAELAGAGLIAPGRVAELEAVAARYAVAITPAVAEAAARSEGVARQFVPAAGELVQTPDERADPIGDAAFSPVEGVVHRYRDRVLLKANHACAVYCRFCFRREMVGPDGVRPLSAAQLDAAMAYIAGDPQIWEVIVTGGDPLILSPRRLGDLMRRLAAIEHVRIVRFHTRVPAADPARITPALVEALRAPGNTTWVGLHANHPDELTPAAAAACARIVDAGIPMVSQTVLLKGVNDDAATLEALMRRFVELRIKPYYLHHPDLAPGTGHFRGGLAEGQALMRALRGTVSGLCQPTYVLDIPGGHGKSPVGPCYVAEGQVEDPNGGRHDYPPR
ncbi:MAG: lysine-2,3-aminomutase-like protein [Phenylobacterium sp.]|uniref:lysine-2,3-aminomutase-like protein n=1 Tax=Phenylobacterium sp. TaxID=1871053 RepID=UPI001A5C1D82|nr:lysine-2,3-aminomutase-like protein [Phenylobacterium sp.]MBL8772535.1 lysine-2,3-aminomutase-like protein [Phenylobacterium sp.]